MKITLEFQKFIKIEDCISGSMIEVPDHCTVRDLLVQLKLPGYLQKAMIVFVNGQSVWNATPLKENDHVKLMRMLSGG